MAESGGQPSDPQRRTFLQSGLLVAGGLAAGALGIGGCSDDSGTSHGAPAEPVSQLTGTQHDEAATALLGGTESAARAYIVQRLNAGASVKDLYLAAFLATLRYVPQGAVTHAGLWTGAAQTLTDDKRVAAGTLMVILDAVRADIRWSQENTETVKVGLPEPGAKDASEELFHSSVKAVDYIGAERAAVALYRGGGNEAVDELFRNAAMRTFRGFGHLAIAADQFLRRLDQLPVGRGEPIVRALARRMTQPDGDGLKATDVDYPVNAARPFLPTTGIFANVDQTRELVASRLPSNVK